MILRIMRLSAIALYPLAVTVEAAGSKHIIQVQIVHSQRIIASLTGRYGIYLKLPVNHIRVAKVERYVRVLELHDRRDAVAAVENPIGVKRFPVSKIVLPAQLVIGKGAVVTIHRHIVAEQDIRVGGAKGRDRLRLSSPYKIVSSGYTFYRRVVQAEGESLKEMDIIPGVRKRAYSWYAGDRRAVRGSTQLPGIGGTGWS